MGMRTVNDPYGDPSVLVDTVFGTSYDAVRDVANNIDYVKKVANLFDTSETIVSNIHQRYVSSEGQNVFELPVAVVSEAFVSVFVNGRWQSPTVTYTAYDTTLTFNQALSQGDVVDAMIVSSETFDALQLLKEETELIRDEVQSYVTAAGSSATTATAAATASTNSATASANSADTAMAAADTVIAIGANIRKNNFTASRAPLPTDDATQGYAEGSRWLWQGQEWLLTETGWVPTSRAPYASRAEAEAATIPSTVQYINVAGVQYIRDPNGTVLETAGGAKWSPLGAIYPRHFGITGNVLIPTHFATINDALSVFGHTRNDKITIQLEAGYQIPVGILLDGGDYSGYTITSVDATVTLAAGFVGVNGQDGFSANSLLVVRRANAPRWSILVNMADLYGCGLVYENKSDGVVSGARGVINAGAYGLYINTQSSVQATNCNFSGAGWGNRVTTNSMLNAPQGNFSGAKSLLYSGSNRTANMDVSRGSIVYITGTVGGETNLTGGLGRGLAVRRSFVSATSVNCSNNADDGLNAAAGAVVAFDSSIASGCGLNGVVAVGAKVSAASVTAINNSNFNLLADAGGEISARNGTFTGGGVQGVRAAQGGQINVNGADCRRNGVSNQITDIVVSDGGKVIAIGALGGFTGSAMQWTAAGIVVTNSDSLALQTSGLGDVSKVMDFDFPNLSTANATFRFLRSTNTTGLRRLQFFRGDGTGTLDVQIGMETSPSFFMSPNFGVGVSNPQRKGHFSDAIRLNPSATPSGASAGDIYFDSSTNKLRCFNGTIWNDLF